MARRSVVIFLLLNAAALAFSGCDRSGTDSRQGNDLVPVELAFSLQGGTSGTKANAAVITELGEEPVFQGLTDIRTVAFNNPGGVVVQATDVALSDPRSLPAIASTIDSRAVSGSNYHKGIIANNHAHLYPDSYGALPLLTNAVLVYGFAPRTIQSTIQEERHLNGSLILNGWDEPTGTLSASKITFEPDPIHTGAQPAGATAIAQIMTDLIAACSYTQPYHYRINDVWYDAEVAVHWDDSTEDPTLREYYDWITGDGQLMTGAGEGLQQMLTVLYRRLTSFESSNDDQFMHRTGGVEYPAVLTEEGQETFTYARLYDGLRDAILDHFDELINENPPRIGITGDGEIRFYESALRTYPLPLGLPSGAAVLRWNGTAYLPVTEGGLDGAARLDRLCYMPPLCYFANTKIRTSETRSVSDLYTNNSPDWETILDQYRLGSAVNRATQAVALEQPLQYACAMMSTTIRATQEILPDADGNDRTNCSATGTNFPITGIIVGGQYVQRFDFTPDETADEYYLYDNNVSGVYLTTAESAPFRTLVLPTPTGNNVYFLLELFNNSGASFTCTEGEVMPGTHFYLAGKLDRSSDPQLPRVFMQDHVTTVRCTVSSLENAHIDVHDMGDPQMVLGVRSDIHWIMSASSYVVLD